MSNLWIPGATGAFARDTRTIEPMSREAAMRLAAASDALQALNLQLVCPTCTARFGHGHDGVEANNEPGARTLEVRCGCTIRRYVQG
jgi:hypothetical protein